MEEINNNQSVDLEIRTFLLDPRIIFSLSQRCPQELESLRPLRKDFDQLISDLNLQFAQSLNAICKKHSQRLGRGIFFHLDGAHQR